MGDMLMSANEAILSTKTSVDGFSLGLTNLITSVGILGFIGILGSLLFFSIGVGNLSLRGLSRIDEYVFQPIISRIEQGDWGEEFGIPVDDRKRRSVTSLLSLLEDAYNLYQRESKL